MDIIKEIMGVMKGSEELYSGLYQDYLQDPLCELPAHVRTTRQKIEMLEKVLPIKGQTILDVGCANGALDIELALQGAYVRGLDHDEKSIKIANMAAVYLDLPVEKAFFWVEDAENVVRSDYDHLYDVVLFLAVWKHIRWRNGLEAANQTLTRLSKLAPVMIFDPGLSDSGTDLGSPIAKTQVPRLICENTDYPHIELISNFKDNLNIEREVWKLWR
jgi:SAM-dependent methyltransferase